MNSFVGSPKRHDLPHMDQYGVINVMHLLNQKLLSQKATISGLSIFTEI